MVRELQPPETGLAFEAMRVLRTDLSDEQDFVHQVDESQRPEGYRLIASFEEGASTPAAIAGFRTGHSLAWGHYLYVDDLSTLPNVRAAAVTPASSSSGCWMRQSDSVATNSTSTRASNSTEPTPTAST